MILMIISITILVIGICLRLCFRRFYVSDFLDPVSFYSTIFGAIAVVFIFIGHYNTDVKIYTKQLERKAIVAQLELTPSEYENTSKLNCYKRFLCGIKKYILQNTGPEILGLIGFGVKNT